MEKEEGVKKKKSYWWIIVIVVIIIVWIYLRNQPTSSSLKETSFVVEGSHQWTSCWNEETNLSINYDLSSNSEVDIIFTPTQKDAADINESSMHYPSCYIPNALTNKATCVIEGKGCLLLLNKKTNQATINLKYSATPV